MNGREPQESCACHHEEVDDPSPSHKDRNRGHIWKANGHKIECTKCGLVVGVYDDFDPCTGFKKDHGHILVKSSNGLLYCDMCGLTLKTVDSIKYDDSPCSTSKVPVQQQESYDCSQELMVAQQIRQQLEILEILQQSKSKAEVKAHDLLTAYIDYWVKVGEGDLTGTQVMCLSLFCNWLIENYVLSSSK